MSVIPLSLVSNIIEMSNDINFNIAIKTDIDPETGEQKVRVNLKSHMMNSLCKLTLKMVDIIHENEILKQRYDMITFDINNEDDIIDYDTSEEESFIHNFNNLANDIAEKFFLESHNLAYKLSGLQRKQIEEFMVEIFHHLIEKKPHLNKEIKIIISGYFYDIINLQEFNIDNDMYHNDQIFVPEYKSIYSSMSIYGIGVYLKKLRNPTKYPNFMNNYCLSIDEKPIPYEWSTCPCNNCYNTWHNKHSQMYPDCKHICCHGKELSGYQGFSLFEYLNQFENNTFYDYENTTDDFC